MKNWADVVDKICFGRTIKFGIGIEFSALQWRLFALWASVVRALAKPPISQLKPVQQSRQQALRAYCPKYILYASVPIVLHLCLIEDVKAKMDPEKVNLNGHKEEKKINIFSCYNDSTQTLHYNATKCTKCYEIDVENILPISN